MFNYYKTADGVYSIEEGRFVDYAGVAAIPLYSDTTGEEPVLADKAFLRQTLEFYKRPVGACLLTLEELRAKKIVEINVGYAEVMAIIKAGYPEDEVSTWMVQSGQAAALKAAYDVWDAIPKTDKEAKAAALAAYNAIPAVFLRSQAVVRGIPLEELCTRVIANAVVWEPLAGSLTAQRQNLELAATNAQTEEEIANVVVNYPLPTGA